MRNKLLFLLGLSISLSCSDSNDKLREKLQGSWTLIGATRNSKSTKTLDGALITFKKDVLTTDITGSLIESPFEIKDGKITTSDSAPDFVIDKMEEESLVLTSHLRSTDFVFIFKRNERQ